MEQRDITVVAIVLLNILIYGFVYYLLISPGGMQYVYPSVFLIMVITNLLAYFSSKRWPGERVLWSLGFGVIPIFLGFYNLADGAPLTGWLAPIGYGVYIILTCSVAGYYGAVARLKKEQQ